MLTPEAQVAFFAFEREMTLSMFMAMIMIWSIKVKASSTFQFRHLFYFGQFFAQSSDLLRQDTEISVETATMSTFSV